MSLRSPPHPGLRGEMVEGVLRPGADIAYGAPPVPSFFYRELE